MLHFRAYLRDPEARIARNARRDIERELAELERSVGTLELAVAPDDATVTIDGDRPEARDGRTFLLPAGNHAIVVAAPGRLSASRSVEIVAGATASVTVRLEAEAPPPEPAPPASLPTPAPPLETLAPPPAASRPPVEDRAQTPPSGPAPWLRWGALGLATATGAAAGVLGSLALDANSRFDEAASRIERGGVDGAEADELRRRAVDDADRANAYALWTDVMLGVTAAAATATVILFVATPRAEVEAGARVDVCRLAGGAAVRVTGTF
ncbi:MAG: hypothetical protein HYY06_08950 [Deltaproteobacteria bacterium]|nr:hypothetical protein [Deltaproteobacteria bacterium]